MRVVLAMSLLIVLAVIAAGSFIDAASSNLEQIMSTSVR